MTGSLGAELSAFRTRHRRVATRGRRGKKVYGLTGAGRSALVARLTAPRGAGRSGVDRTFPLRVAFCRHLRPAQRLGLFERRRAELAARLDDDTGPDRRLDTYLRALRERDTESTRHDLAWLDRLIHAERRAVESHPDHHGGTTP